MVVVVVAAVVVVAVGLGAVSYPEGLPNNLTQYAVKNVTRSGVNHICSQKPPTLCCYNSHFNFNNTKINSHEPNSWRIL